MSSFSFIFCTDRRRRTSTGPAGRSSLVCSIFSAHACQATADERAACTRSLLKPAFCARQHDRCNVETDAIRDDNHYFLRARHHVGNDGRQTDNDIQQHLELAQSFTFRALLLLLPAYLPLYAGRCRNGGCAIRAHALRARAHRDHCQMRLDLFQDGYICFGMKTFMDFNDRATYSDYTVPYR